MSEIKIENITGMIHTTDGKTRSFTIGEDGGWQQWGASAEDLGNTVDALEAIARVLMEDDLIASVDDDHEEED